MELQLGTRVNGCHKVFAQRSWLDSENSGWDRKAYYSCATHLSRGGDSYLGGINAEDAGNTDTSAKGPFQLVEIDIPEPVAGSVRIKVQACASVTATNMPKKVHGRGSSTAHPRT